MTSASLAEVSTYLPPVSMPITTIGARLGLSDTELVMYRQFFGLDKVRLAPNSSLVELMLAAAAGLTTLGTRRHDISFVLHARTFQAAEPHGSNAIHEVRAALGLPRASAFAVTQHACASGLLAIDIAAKLLATEANPNALALIFMGERAFTPALRFLAGTTFMGEGTAACLVGRGGDHDRMLAFETRTLGRYHQGLRSPKELVARFQGEYLPTLGAVICAAVARAGMTLDDIAAILPHNVNRISWIQLCRRLGYPVDRVYLDNVPVTGHCFCADPLINYQGARARGILRSGQRYLMINVGLGATFSAMMFEH
jgi:3-oxoacyl-[acyl-carrier-protein] synthase III